MTLNNTCLLYLQPATLTTQPRVTCGGAAGRSPRYRGEAMDLSYVTERIIALWVPGDVSPVAYRQGQQKAAHMLQTKHGNNYMASLCCYGVRKKGCKCPSTDIGMLCVDIVRCGGKITTFQRHRVC